MDTSQPRPEVHASNSASVSARVLKSLQITVKINFAMFFQHLILVKVVPASTEQRVMQIYTATSAHAPISKEVATVNYVRIHNHSIIQHRQLHWCHVKLRLKCTHNFIALFHVAL